MKEERYDLTTLQRIFLEKVIQKIEGGWDKYSWNTQQGIQRTLDRGTYDKGNKEFYNELRKDYIKDFIRVI